MILRWQQCKKTTSVLLLSCLISISALFTDDNDERRCTSGFQEYSEYSNSSFRICSRILFTNSSPNEMTFVNMTWDKAEAACNGRFSFLLDTDSRFYNTSNLQAELSSIVMELVWIGIRKMSGFYTWKTSNKRLFHTMEDWGNDWQNEEEPVDDCVAMNVSSGLLLTFPCESIELPVVCMNNGLPIKPVESLVCKYNWTDPYTLETDIYLFSYQLDYGSENCIKVFPPQKFSVSETHCIKEGGQLLSSEDYLNLYHTLVGSYLGNISSAYWFSDSFNSLENFQSGLCQGITMIGRSSFNCSDELSFICKKSIYKNFTLKSRIHPYEMTSFPSTDMSYKELTCYGRIGDSECDLFDPLFAFQWYKNGIPISNSHAIHPASVYDDSKENGDLASRQGTFQCEVIIAGVMSGTPSQKINIFFSDVSTLILTISGSSIPYNISEDFSRPSFELAFNLIRQPIDDLVELTQELFPKASVFWDLQNISSNDIESTVAVLIFLNWTSEAGIQRPIREKQDVYDPLFQMLEKNLYLFDEWGSTSLTLKSADVCFSKTLKMTKSNETVTLSWPETFQSSRVTSNPTCKTRQNLGTHTCEGSVVNGARWSDFDQSICMSYKPSVADFVDPCPEGFEYINGETCIQYHTDTKNWDEALNTCAASLSYMADATVFKDEFRTGSVLKDKEFWISHRPINGIIQPAGISTQLIQKHLLFYLDQNIMKQNDQCLTLNLRNREQKTGVISSYNCTKRLPFVCIMKPIQLSPVSLCPKNWIGSLFHDKCYYIGNQELSWEDSISSCPKIQTGAKILELHDRNSYSLLRSFIQDKPLLRKSNKWWMGLTMTGKKLTWLTNHTQAEFVDWHVETKLWNNESAGIIIHDVNVKASTSVKWMLDNVYNKNRYICEVPISRILRAAYARVIVKDYNIIKYENFFIKLPQLYCHLSGDFVPNSFMWFKDGFPVKKQSGNFFPLNQNVLTFKDLTKLQGYYECSVFQITPFKRVFSEKFLYKVESQMSKLRVKITEIKTFAISLNSNFNFKKECLNFATGYFEEKAPSFLIELNSLLNASYSNHIVLKNISCLSSGVNILMHLHLQILPSSNSKRYISNDDKEDLLKISDHLKKSVSPILDSWLEKYEIDKNNITVRSTISCYEEKTRCGHKNVTWPETPISHIAVAEELCVTETGEAVYRRCLGDYNIGASWGPIHGSCSGSTPQLTASLHQLSNEVISKDNIWNVSYSLSQLTSSYEDLNTADIHYVTKTLVNIAEDPFIEENVILFATQSVNNVLSADSIILGDSQSHLNTSSQIIESLERMVITADFQNSNYQLTMDNIAVNFQSLQTSNHSFPVGTAAMSVHGNKIWNITTIFNGSTLPLSDIEAGVLLPTNLVIGEYLENATNPKRQLSFIMYRNPAFFQSQNKVTVVSSIVQAFIGDEYLIDLEPQVKMLFRLSENVNFENFEQVACVFWDQRLNDTMGAWSREGCSTVSFFSGIVECQCDHLTSFAVILEHTEHAISRPHRVSLSIITYVGCCLSIFGLGMTILTYAIFKKWRRGSKHQTLCNLSVALLFVLLIFLIGINRKDSVYGCIIVAILLHYFMLASIAWMLVEAVIQYLNFVKVYGSYIPRFMQKAMCFAWGMPLLIVCIILSIDYELYNGQQKYCWLSNKAFYYAFALPVLVMLVINLVIFIVILYCITCGRDKSLRCNQSEKKHTLTCIRAAFCIFVLLGLSWLFGFLAIDGAQLVFHYLFAISTTLQGFFIFLLFVVQEKTARELWQNFIFPYTIPTKSQNSHSTGDVSVSHAMHGRIKS